MGISMDGAIGLLNIVFISMLIASSYMWRFQLRFKKCILHTCKEF